MEGERNLAYTTGSDEGLEHIRKIAFGGYGEVHEVVPHRSKLIL